MKDFDAERQARHRLQKAVTFKLGGHTFTVRNGVRPDVIAAAEDIDETNTAREVIGSLDDTVLAFIDPKGGAHKKYRDLRAREDDPITLQDIFALVKWLVEEYTARPTEPSGPSSRGRGRTGTPSTGNSRGRRGAPAKA